MNGWRREVVLLRTERKLHKSVPVLPAVVMDIEERKRGERPVMCATLTRLQ